MFAEGLRKALPTCIVALSAMAFCFGAGPDLPQRRADALSGSQFAGIIWSLPLEEREHRIAGEVATGNVPQFYRTFVPVNFSGSINGVPHTGTYFAAPEYLAVGSDQDYLLIPVTPLLAQRLCDHLDCTLPTRKMVNQIWTNAMAKLSPQPIPPSPQMTTVAVFVDHNSLVRTQRVQQLVQAPLGSLVAGHKKDLILSTRIYTNFAIASVTRPVVIYGWHYLSGAPIQPLYNGHHDGYADYSHGARLILNQMILDGTPAQIPSILKDPARANLLSDEGASEGTVAGVIAKPFYRRAPQDPTRILSARLPANGQLEIKFSAVPGVMYEVQKSPEMVQWNGVASLTATASSQEFSDTLAGPLPAFYRIRRITP